MRRAVSAEPGGLRVRRYSWGWGFLALTAGMIVIPVPACSGSAARGLRQGSATVTISRSAAGLLAAASRGSGWCLLMRGLARRKGWYLTHLAILVSPGLVALSCGRRLPGGC